MSIIEKYQGSRIYWVMPAVSEEVAILLPHHDLDFSEVNEYSHLNYGYLQLDFGLEFQAAPRVTLTADGEYADLSDKTGYVYGVESGSYFMVRTGV